MDEDIDIYQALADAIRDVVNSSDAPANERAAKVRDAVDSGDLAEFLAWFET